MLITREESLINFDTWSGANETKDELTYAELDIIEGYLENEYPNGMSEVELNDFLWFEQDTIAEWLGYSDWDDLVDNQDERYEDVYGER